LKPKNCYEHQCLANFRTFQDLASRFPGLSRIKVIFSGFSRSWKLTTKIPGLLENFPGGVGTLLIVKHSRSSWSYLTGYNTI